MAWLVDSCQCRTVAEPEGRSRPTVVSVVRWQSQKGVAGRQLSVSYGGRARKGVASRQLSVSIKLRRDSSRSIIDSYPCMAAVACSPISDFLSSIVTGSSLWVSFLLHMVTALCSPMGAFLLSSMMTHGPSSMGIFSHIWWQVPAPYMRIPLSHILLVAVTCSPISACPLLLVAAYCSLISRSLFSSPLP
jgi:hypothetical protein